MSASKVGIGVLARAFVLAFARAHGVVRQPHALVEAIHVQLSHKGSIIVMFEKLRDQGLGKLVLVQHDKRISFLGPANQVLVLPLFKKAGLVKLVQKFVDNKHEV